MNKEELDLLAGSMSEEEMRARTEAHILGKFRIIEVALAALITQATNPDIVRDAIVETLNELRDAKPQHPNEPWAPTAIHAGADALAQYLLVYCSRP